MTRLLLHICCGPCATTVIERLRENYDITGYYYNPNIHPSEEYRHRLKAAHLATHHFGVQFIEGTYDPDRYLDLVKGYEGEPEDGRRCDLCYRMRLEATALYAVRNGFDAFASTLTLGPRKRADVINPIGGEIADRHGIVFIEGDWKKKDGFRRSLDISREMGLYRQHYCGCSFSMRPAGR